ncbi:hypothetical protein GW17_00054195 [Ensete ventricosum]|nr:hypothetical protein GW17_00054195 [Ensete ventricosum]RZS04050.1 hypothetical protein BHM03_00034343 [Ensete ventricosum]
MAGPWLGLIQARKTTNVDVDHQREIAENSVVESRCWPPEMLRPIVSSRMVVFYTKIEVGWRILLLVPPMLKLVGAGAP